MSRSAILWSYIAAAPAWWFLAMEANFAIARRFCSGAPPWVPILISITALVGTATLGWNASRQIRSEAGEAPNALAAGAAFINACSAVLIAAQAIPTLMLAGCH